MAHNLGATSQFAKTVYQEGCDFRSKDPRRAFACFLDAAERGSAEAQYSLAMAYANGTGVKKNQNKSLQWLKKAAEQGFPDATQLLAKIEATYAKNTRKDEPPGSAGAQGD